jgi:hypothetical protein
VDALSSPDCNKEALIAEGVLEHLNETAPTTDSAPRVGALTPNIEVTGTETISEDEITDSSPVETTSDKHDDASARLSEHADDPGTENNNSTGSTIRPTFVSARTSASVVPSQVIHTENTWVMKLGDDFEWHVSVSQSIYAGIREALASCSTFARGCKLRIQRCQCPAHRHHRRVSPSVNGDHRQQRWRAGETLGLDDLEEGWEAKVEAREKIDNNKDAFRHLTRAHLLQGGIEAGVRSKYSRRQKASSKPHRVHLGKILESTKEFSMIAEEGVQPEEKGGEDGSFAPTSRNTAALSSTTTSEKVKNDQ